MHRLSIYYCLVFFFLFLDIAFINYTNHHLVYFSTALYVVTLLQERRLAFIIPSFISSFVVAHVLGYPTILELILLSSIAVCTWYLKKKIASYRFIAALLIIGYCLVHTGVKAILLHAQPSLTTMLFEIFMNGMLAFLYLEILFVKSEID